MTCKFCKTPMKELKGHIYHGNRSFLTALAFTLFTWVVCMNAMDLLPVDLPGNVAKVFGADHFRVLPTADLNGTIAMAIVERAVAESKPALSVALGRERAGAAITAAIVMNEITAFRKCPYLNSLPLRVKTSAEKSG